jgi:hypothetical protein
MISFRHRHMLSAGAALLLGLALRIYLLAQFTNIVGDSLIYGDIAKNLLQYGIYGMSGGQEISSTLIRLPGYPLFLAACFRVFGMEHYVEILWLQLALDLCSCILLWRFAARRFSPIAGQVTLWLAALCPFTAICISNPLAETLSFFCLSLALFAVGRFLDQPNWRWTLLFTFAISYGTLLRPDGALAAVALWPVLLFSPRLCQIRWKRALRFAAVSALLSVLPFTVWAYRNWQVFHVFQPLAPRYATDPGEDTYPGYIRWVKTWCTDFSHTYLIYWTIPTDKVDVNNLPAIAFDSEDQRERTVKILNDYNNRLRLDNELDEEFAALAKERIADHPVHYYLVLPAMRVANMWFRPRTEQFPFDVDWWNYDYHDQESLVAIAMIYLNVGYLFLALLGAIKKPPLWQVMVLYCLLRSTLLWTIEAPETRYTLECFPFLFVLAGAVFWKPASTCLPSLSP